VTPTRLSTLVAVSGITGIVAWSGLRLLESSGGRLLPLPWTALGGMVLIAVAVVASGWPVRRWTRGERSRPLDPLRAARVLVLARASAYSGSALAGFYAAQAVLVLPDLSIEPRRERLGVAALATGAAVLMVVAGLVVERWCRLPGDEDEERRGPGRPQDGVRT
jgi:hypothetical protein